MTLKKITPAASLATRFMAWITHKFPIISLQSDGPWGGSGAGNDDDNGKNGPSKNGPGRNGPDKNAGSKKPEADNPWAFPQGERRPNQKRAPSALDQILGAGKARMGGGGGNFPTLPNGRPIWPLLGLGFVAIWLLWTSVWRIDAQEAGVVSSFGSYSHTLGEGLNFTLPAPFHTVQKVQISEQKLQIGSTDPSNQTLVLTSDKNLIDLAYTVRWNVRTPSLFLFQLANEGDDINKTLAAVAETSMRAAVANLTLDGATGVQRQQIGQDVRQRMQAILDGYRAGIQIRSIDIRQTDPPLAVAEAFKEVQSAEQQAEAQRNRAETYARQVVETAKGEAQAFDAVYEQYRLAPDVTKRRMYYETMERVLGKLDKTIIEANGVTPYLPLSEMRRRTPAPEAEGLTVTAPKRTTETPSK